MEQAVIPNLPVHSHRSGRSVRMSEEHSRKQSTSSDASSPSSESSSSSSSGSSTLIYDHEPFEQFKDRVQTLCNSLGRPRRKSFRQKCFQSRLGQYASATKICGSIFRHWLPTSEDFEIERLSGGGFNRVIGITIPKSYKSRSKVEREFVLRIPRFEDARPDREVATLKFIQHRTSIPIAHVVAKDFSCNNALGKPYVIQRRLPGKDLYMSWADLTHKQRRIVAHEHAKTLLTLQSLTSPAPGLIGADTEAFGSGRGTMIVPYELKNGQGLVKEPDSDRSYVRKDATTLGFFIHQMDRWRAVALKKLGKSGSDVASYNVALWGSLIEAAEEMNRLGLFNDDKMSLCHLDLQPRNIMAQIQNGGSLNITGYLDWDSAVFAPRFVGCAPPRWLWADQEGDYDEDDEHGAGDIPSTPEKQELKRIFEEAVGADYLHYAYAPQYPLARLLFRIAKNGVWSNEHLADVDEFMAEWDKLRRSLEGQVFPGFGGFHEV